MENEKEQNEHINLPRNPIENDYEEHKEDPGPSVEAVEEKGNNGAGRMLKFVIPIVVVILFIIWMLVKNK